MTTVYQEARARLLTMTTLTIWEDLGNTSGSRDFGTLNILTDLIDTEDSIFHT